MPSRAATRPPKSDARLDVRLQQQSKDLIEEAAALSGQSISDYVVSTLVRHSAEVLEKHRHVRLSNRDRDRFLALLEADDEPNEALRRAAKGFKRRAGRPR